jgi:RHS repeat-associated protein
MPLGSFTLEPGQDHRIELRNVGSLGRINADAVRLVYEGERLMVAADAVRFVPNAISGAAYVHGDHLGTPAKMTGDAGTVIWDAAYKPFGGEASVVGSENLDLRFPGQIQDLESGRGLASLVMPLHYNYFRDYDPASGRYLQVDPIGLAGGLNTYGYVGGNPLAYTDRRGLALDTFADVFFIGADIGILLKENVFGNCDTLAINLFALGADIVGLATPGVTGLGPLARAAAKAGKAPTPKAPKNNPHIGDSGGSGGGGGGSGSAGVDRTGMKFTPKTKKKLDADNAARNGGVNKCENCGVQTVPGQKSQRGVTPSTNERHRDHIIPKSKGGDGIFENGRILCRTCNLKKRDK